MDCDRRSFIKFVVTGSIAALCPFDLSPAAEAAPAPAVDGDHFDICHKVRDGYRFPTTPPSARHDIAIIGGGMSGLTAAYLLRDHDFVLFEKEPHWGGNAYLEEYDGQSFATGAAFTGRNDLASHLSKEIGIEPLPVNDPDGTLINGLFVPDTWHSGLDDFRIRPKSVEPSKNFATTC